METPRVEGGHLPERVDAGVGAARTLQTDFLAPDFLERGLDALLHGALGRLPLPTGELRAAICDG